MLCRVCKVPYDAHLMRRLSSRIYVCRSCLERRLVPVSILASEALDIIASSLKRLLKRVQSRLNARGYVSK